MNWLDKKFDKHCRLIAASTSRRSFVARLGVFVAGASLLPLLPVSRVSAQDTDNDEVPSWRYCGIDGWLCSCCGGTTSQCPPGSTPSPITWIGTCNNPDDGKAYVISYNDCCGKGGCGRCFCNRNEGDTPQYRPQRSNSITWCYGGATLAYHCSIARVLGLANE